MSLSAADPGPARRPWMERLSDPQWRAIDCAAATVALGLALGRVAFSHDAQRLAVSPGVLMVLVALGTAPLVRRRSRPMGAFAVMVLASAVTTALGLSLTTCGIAVGFVVYTLAARPDRGRAAMLVLIGELCLWAGSGVAIARGAHYLGESIAITVMFPAVMWFIGDGARSRDRWQRVEMARREQEQQRLREQGRHIVREERMRIARELHDVVAHGLTVMTVQAGVARRLRAADGEIVGALESIELVGRGAQEELGLILRLLRADGQPAELTPAPGLADLPDLVEHVRAAGLDVELASNGRPSKLSAALELSLYRVIQESLTNVVRHAGPARATVALSYLPDCVELEVRDWSVAARDAATRSGGAGHGITGMRERVQAHGGVLEAGAVAPGEFRVRATVPLHVAP